MSGPSGSRSAGIGAGLKSAARIAGPLLLLLTLVLPAPEGLSPAGWRTAGVGLLMAVWWVTEALPIPATALLPLVLFPVLGVADMDSAARPYAHPLIFLFMGGFMIALAMERWQLPRRVSLLVIRALGTRPERLIDRELEELGPVSSPERRVAAVFSLTAAAWVTRPLIEDAVPGLTDAGIAMTGAAVLFLVPSGAKGEPGGEGSHDGAGEGGGRHDAPGAEGEGGSQHPGFLLNWEWAKRVPWGVLILFGGGLSLAGAISDTGLTEWIGGAVGGLSSLPTLAIVAVATAVTVLLTELTSNTATAAAFLPIMASVAVGIGESPFLLVVPAALAASCAFMLPVATPPNAIVYGSGRLSIPQMARAGVWLNLALVALVTALVYLLLPVVFGVTFGTVPAWAA